MLLLSLSLSQLLHLTLARSMLSWPRSDTIRHDDDDDSEFHSFMIHELASSRFHIFSSLSLSFSLPFVVVIAREFQTTTKTETTMSNKVPKKNFYDCAVTLLFTHTQLIYACFYYFFIILLFYCVLSHLWHKPRTHYWQIPFKLSTSKYSINFSYYAGGISLG